MATTTAPDSSPADAAGAVGLDDARPDGSGSDGAGTDAAAADTAAPRTDVAAATGATGEIGRAHV